MGWVCFALMILFCMKSFESLCSQHEGRSCGYRGSAVWIIPFSKSSSAKAIWKKGREKPHKDQPLIAKSKGSNKSDFQYAKAPMFIQVPF